MDVTYASDAMPGLRELRAALKQVAVGDGLVYYTGQTWCIPGNLARAAMTLFEEGRVHLVQRRVGAGPDAMPVRDYIAIKRLGR